MSDYEETARRVREGELKVTVEDMRAVQITDGRNTIVDLQIRDPYVDGGWASISVGTARRRKGDRRNPDLAVSLAIYRALARTTEEHREKFARQFPGFFPKTPDEVREARAAIHEAHKQIDRATEEIGAAENAIYRANQLDKRITEALELLESSPEAFRNQSAHFKAALATLREDIEKSTDTRLVETALVEDLAVRAHKALRGDSE